MSRYSRFMDWFRDKQDIAKLVCALWPDKTKKAQRILVKVDKVQEKADAVNQVFESEMPGGVEAVPEPETKFCQNCGAQWPTKANFCGFCGEPLG